MSVQVKDPGARVGYAVDWSDYLDGAAVAASGWTVTPAGSGGLAIVASGHDFARCEVLVDGGAAGRVYRLTNRVTLSDGSADERSIDVRVEQL